MWNPGAGAANIILRVGRASGLPRFGILPNRFVAAGCRDGQAGRPPYPVLASWRAICTLLAALVLPCSAQELTTATLDAAGSVTSAGNIEITGSLGGIGGLSSDAGLTARAGFPGQIYDPVSLSATPAPAIVVEEGTLQLAPVILCDDDTTLPATSVLWETGSPFLTIGSSTGLITAGRIPGDRSETVRLTAAGLTSDLPITLLDATPDNYGPFAGDGLDDAWQWEWFSADPASGAPGSDPDSDGQDNALECLAGTTPLDGSSFLQVRVEPVTGDPNARILLFTPWRPDRSYTWESSTTLQPPWTPVPGATVDATLDNEGTATDASATESRKLYRLHIE